MFRDAGRLEALLLDAGNTIVFLDMEAVAEVVRAQGVMVAPERLGAVEGAAKRRYEAELGGGQIKVGEHQGAANAHAAHPGAGV